LVRGRRRRGRWKRRRRRRGGRRHRVVGLIIILLQLSCVTDERLVVVSCKQAVKVFEQMIPPPIQVRLGAARLASCFIRGPLHLAPSLRFAALNPYPPLRIPFLPRPLLPIRTHAHTHKSLKGPFPQNLHAAAQASTPPLNAAAQAVYYKMYIALTLKEKNEKIGARDT
jgi:hypothetical protein